MYNEQIEGSTITEAKINFISTNYCRGVEREKERRSHTHLQYETHTHTHTLKLDPRKD